MLKQRQVFHARPPDLHDVRGDRHLWVWGDLAQWMVVDDELAGLFACFDGRRTLGNVLQAHAKAVRKPLKTVEAEVLPSIEALVRRGILCETLKPARVAPETPRIANVTINLTNRCNLRCRWCYNVDRTTDEMPIGALMDAIERGKGVLDINASLIVLGGEPFLMPERLMEALDRAQALSAAPTSVSTNGTLLTASVVEALAGRRIEIQVSLDSAFADRHDAIRGPGVFDKAVAGVRRLVDRGVPTLLSMVYTRENYLEFEPYLDLARTLGVTEARFIPMRLVGAGTACRDLAPDQVQVFQHLMGLLGRRPELRPLVRRDFFSILTAVCRYTASRTGCGIGRRVVFIDADGQVYPCPNHTRPEHVCGDLRNESLEDVFLRSPAFRRVREQYNVSRYSACKTCVFRHWCAGDCRGEVLALTGDPLGPSPHCAELQEVITSILWLIADADVRLGASRLAPDGKKAEDVFLS